MKLINMNKDTSACRHLDVANATTSTPNLNWHIIDIMLLLSFTYDAAHHRVCSPNDEDQIDSKRYLKVLCHLSQQQLLY